MADTAHEDGRLVHQTLLVLLLVVAAAALIFVLLYAADLVLMMVASIVLAASLHGVANWVGRQLRLEYGWSLALVCLVLLIVLILAIILLAPRVDRQIERMSQDIPEAVGSLSQRLEHYSWGRWILRKTEQPTEQLVGAQRDVLNRVTGMVSSTLSGIVSVLLMLLLALLLAVSPGLYVDNLVRLWPVPKRQRVRQILSELAETWQRWLLGMMGSALVVGLLTGLSLWLLNIELALSLALIAALFTFVPNIGPVVAAIPAVLIGLLHGPSVALWVMLAYVVVQMLESYLITPYIQLRAISLPPALLIFVQLLMGVLAGLVGVVMAAPLTAASFVLIKRLYLQDVLHEPVTEPGG